MDRDHLILTYRKACCASRARVARFATVVAQLAFYNRIFKTLFFFSINNILFSNIDKYLTDIFDDPIKKSCPKDKSDKSSHGYMVLLNARFLFLNPTFVGRFFKKLPLFLIILFILSLNPKPLKEYRPVVRTMRTSRPNAFGSAGFGQRPKQPRFESFKRTFLFWIDSSVRLSGPEPYSALGSTFGRS